MIQTRDLSNGQYEVKVTMDPVARPAERHDMPYPPNFQVNEMQAVLSHNEDMTPPAEVRYTKRPGGCYIYSNNPEMLAPEDVGQLILRNDGLTGECFFTYEHSNHTGEPFFLGYQLYNGNDHDVTVKVLNIGNQVRGEWLGQREWVDFYGMEFDLPKDYFLEDGKTVNPIYVGGDYVRYQARPFVVETVTVPAGAYYWVLGGTSGDLPVGSISGSTADQAILVGRCANGAVRFVIEGGEMLGTFWCYTDPSQCDRSKKEQGYIVNRNDHFYGAQYKGIDRDTLGLLETEISFLFSDETKAGNLPVKYTVSRDPNYTEKKEPYNAYEMQDFTVEGNRWLTALNPNEHHTAIGTDMIVFECVTEDGQKVCIDNEHADGSGAHGNTGNWMVQYTEHYNFANVGKKDRRVRLYTRNTGVLMVVVRDEAGEVLEKKLILQPYNFAKLDDAFAGVDRSLLVEKNGRWWFNVDGKPFCDVWDERSLAWETEVAAESTKRFSVDVLILANSCGGIHHWVELD